MNKTRITAAAMLCAAALFPAATALSQAAEPESDLYYLEAEVVETLGNATRFGQVDGREPSSLTYQTPGLFSPDIPYLLTMDTIGTADPEDDEILVVWGCMTGET